MRKSVFLLSIHALCAVVLLVAGMSCMHAKPMDSLMGQQVPSLQRIVLNIRNNGRLSEEDIATVAKCIDSGDPVLLSAAAWIVGEYKGKAGNLLDKLKALQQDKLDRMAEAFVRIALEKNMAKKEGRPWKPRPGLQNDANPYMRMEYVRELLLVNKDEGMAAARKLLEDKDPMVKFAARGFSDHSMRGTLSDELYEMMFVIIAGGI